MVWLTPDEWFVVLVWIMGGLILQLLGMLVLGSWLQARYQRFNQRRIACHQRWETEVVEYLYGGERDAGKFLPLKAGERRLFITFLLRVLGTLAGSEGEAIRELYGKLGLSRGLSRRLGSRLARQRALAALEVGSFQVEAHYGHLRALLEDPVPHVAHAAARGLGSTQRLAFAEPVLTWVLTQEVFQQERLLWILESFGAEFMRWLEARLDGDPQPPLAECILYAQLAASTRRVEEPSRLMAFLDAGEPELEAAALKALGALGRPEALGVVLARKDHPSWVIRAQAAKAIGILAGPAGVPALLDLLGDPRFEVRRNAALALHHMGAAGIEALRVVAEDPYADPFARDLACERLQWLAPAWTA